MKKFKIINCVYHRCVCTEQKHTKEPLIPGIIMQAAAKVLAENSKTKFIAFSSVITEAALLSGTNTIVNIIIPSAAANGIKWDTLKESTVARLYTIGILRTIKPTKKKFVATGK